MESRWWKREVECEIGGERIGSNGVKRKRRSGEGVWEARAEVEKSEMLEERGWRKRYG